MHEAIRNDTLLAGRKVLVTGAARGLGLAFVKALAEAGADAFGWIVRMGTEQDGVSGDQPQPEE